VPLTVAVYVQSHAGRAALVEQLRLTLEASDVGTDYKVLLHPPGQPIADFFHDVLGTMGQSTADLVVRLEDDVLVNRHFRHNTLTWPALHEPSFGMGWLMSPPLGIWDVIYGKRCRNPTAQRQIPICVANVFWTRDMPWIIEGSKRWFARHGGTAMDFALSTAVVDGGRMSYLHTPCIAEHNTRAPSTLGHHHKREHTSAGLYRRDWKRP